MIVRETWIFAKAFNHKILNNLISDRHRYKNMVITLLKLLIEFLINLFYSITPTWMCHCFIATRYQVYTSRLFEIQKNAGWTRKEGEGAGEGDRCGQKKIEQSKCQGSRHVETLVENLSAREEISSPLGKFAKAAYSETFQSRRVDT